MQKRNSSYCTFYVTLLFIIPLFVLSRPNTSEIQLFVDATEAPRKILHAHEIISVEPGELTLFYPKWIPGEHGPTGPVIDVAGFKISAGEKTIAWRRDLEEMNAIHCVIPPKVKKLEISFDFILPPLGAQFTSGASSSVNLLVLNWNQVIFYPLSVKPDNITVTSVLTLLAEWKYATALTTQNESGNVITFAPVSLNMLIDSPVITGKYFRTIDLTPSTGIRHTLNLVGDDDASLELSPAHIAQYKNLVQQAYSLFGTYHYNHYDFLLTLSDQVAHFGLEHHQSSDNRVGETTFSNENLFTVRAGLLPHEFAHSWNGKYRRPMGLVTNDFSTPMKDDMLWVYEGLTEYLGGILTARSGLNTPEEYLQDLANVAASLDNRPGRTWRPLQDVNDEASLLYNARGDWDSWRRDVDFYDEGNLIWLEADVTIRQLSQGKKSLDDFCKKFFGGENKGPELQPYTFDDVVKTLNAIVSFDWKNFFATRLNSLHAHAPLGGIERGGWKLVYKDEMNEMQKSASESRGRMDLRYSLGFILGKDGRMQDVIPGTPADKVGLGPDMVLMAVNGRKFSQTLLREAIKKAKNSTNPIELLVTNGDFYYTYSIDYHDGERYPCLEKDSTKTDVLSAILQPVASK